MTAAVSTARPPRSRRACGARSRTRRPGRRAEPPEVVSDTGGRDLDPVRPLDGRQAQPGSSRLTVIVPAYNEATSVADTVRSLQRQTCPPREIVVVDDCSTDGT